MLPTATCASILETPARSSADGERASAFEPSPTRRAPAWLARLVQGLERDERLDGVARQLGAPASALASSGAAPALRGEWLGHALHPLLTDLPLGCWLSAGLLDLIGGRRSRPAAQRLVGLGLLFVPPTAASGLVDWSSVTDQRVRRVGAVHGVGNLAVGGAYFLSWRARRAGHHYRGATWGIAGGLLAWATGYLGGHLSFARGTGVGPRGIDGTPSSSPPAPAAPPPLPA